MKKFISWILLCCALLEVHGQVNLVKNPSFEDTVFCPWAENQMPKDWLCFGASPDYYNGCSEALNVPNTPTGYHPANSGVGMIGLFTYVSPLSTGWPDYREFVGVPLTSSLTIGEKYYISFFINFSLRYSIGLNTNAIGADKLGMKFSTVQYFENNPPSLNNTAHLYTDSIYIDTAQWVNVSGSFIADSAYNYLMLGNFFDEAHTDTLYLDGLNDWTFESYYFIDDICVTTDSLYNETWLGVETWGAGNFSNTVSVFPNPASNFVTISSDLQTAFDIEVYNTIGHLLSAKQNISADNLQLDISQYNNGLLFIKITSQNNQSIYKLLKQ